MTTTGPPGSWPDLPYAGSLEREGFTVHQRLIGEADSVRQLVSTLQIGSAIRNYDLVVANEYSTALGLGLLALLFRAKARMVVVGLNLSRRPFKFAFRPLQKVVDGAFGRYDAIVVHSSPEVDSFVDLHKLERSRFTVIPWGFDLPVHDGPPLPGLPARYVSVIGRNNRDFATVAEGLAGTGVGGVFVGADKSLESADPPIHCFESLPFEECLRIIEGSLATVILVNDAGRGAGHITAVSGMLLGKPHVFSNVATLSEYLRDGHDGIAVPLGDSAAFHQAVAHLASDPALAARMGHEGRDHALREMSHQVFMARLVNAILDTRK
jgi:hypothetical protein